jgi:prepilin-type N-terminal cleavage/methylation domain-containing protein
MNPIKLHSGFTLIEVAMVMVIIGLILATSIAPLNKQIERSRIQETTKLLDEIEQAVYGFAIANRRLPCPADADSQGRESHPGNGRCNVGGGNDTISGFVPGQTLGLSGKYNEDVLLLDAWNNPIRYAVTQSNTNGANIPDFTSTTVPFDNVATATLDPNLVICDRNSANVATCAPNNMLANNAVVVIISLGADGAKAVNGGGMVAAQLDQINNSGERTLAAAPASGRRYRIGGAGTLPQHRIFISHAAVENKPGLEPFDDQLRWISPFTLYSKMNLQ